MKKCLGNEQGYSLLLAIFVLVLVSILGFTILIVSGNTLNTSNNERLDQSLYYIAEGGLVEKRSNLYRDIRDAHNDAITQYKNNLQSKATPPPIRDFKVLFLNQLNAKVDLSNSNYVHFKTQYSYQPKSVVRITRSTSRDKVTYTIIATGTINGNSRRVTQDIEVLLDSAFLNSGGTGNTGDFAVYTKNNITFGYYDIRTNVKGHLASASNSKVNVNGWNPEPINITYDPKSFDMLVKDTFQKQLNFDSNYFGNILYRPNGSSLIKDNSLIGNWNEHNNKTLTLSDNLKLNTFSTSSNLTFNIDVGNSDKIIYVNNFTFNGTLNILGSGNLTIYVKDNINFQHSKINVNGNPNKLNIYYAGTNKITIANGIELKGNLYIKDADLDFSGGAEISGSFYSNGHGKTKIDGGTISNDVVFIVPTSDVTITGGANFKGSILSNSLLIDGGSKIDSSAGGGLGGNVQVGSTDPIKPKSIVEID